MNLLLIGPNDLVSQNQARIYGARFNHIIQILKSTAGCTIRIGFINGNIGEAVIQQIQSDHLILQFKLDQPPPPPLPLGVILALPRPKMVRRILKNIAELGIKELYLIQTAKVEKSYWQSPFLEPDRIQTYFLEGLSQSRDTIMPDIQIKRRFRPFIEDELPGIIAERETFVAHPYDAELLPQPSSTPRLVVIGPEGGFNEFEIQLLKAQQVKPISMGERIYRVENALTLLSARLSYPC